MATTPRPAGNKSAASPFTPAAFARTPEANTSQGSRKHTAGLAVRTHERRGTLSPYTLLALGLLDAAGFRFGRHKASLTFPLWTAGMAMTWPWLRVGREGMGIQLLVAGR